MNQTKVLAFVFFIPTLFINHITLTIYDHDQNLSIFSIVLIAIFNIVNLSFCISLYCWGIKKSLIFYFYIFCVLILIDTAFEKFINTEKTVKEDKFLGWILKKNINIKIYQETAEKEKYEINYKTSKVEGFREYGNTKVKRENKILLIGDSFANAPFASNEKMFYSLIDKEFKKNNLFYEWFVGGAGGYGTLQQYILLKNHIKKIDPSVIILQFCSNDFENNSYNLEKKTIVRSQKFRRPYLINKTIVKNNSIEAKIYRVLSNNSYVFNTIDLILSNIQYRKYSGYFFEKPKEGEYEESIAITNELISKIVNLTNNKTRIYSINCSIEDKKKTEAWLSIANKLGIIALIKPNQMLEIAEKNGSDIWHRDRGHLNNLGNKIYGKSIANEIIAHFKKF